MKEKSFCSKDLDFFARLRDESLCDQELNANQLFELEYEQEFGELL